MDVYLEVGARRTFAVAHDWPGWARSAKTRDEALDALASYRDRYAVIAERAGLEVPAADDLVLEVVEEVEGSATTDFGAIGAVTDRDRETLSGEEAARQAALVRAAWAVFDEIAASSSPTLTKGPRGGGRDRDEIVEHVVEAERSYARTVGVRHRPFDAFDEDARSALRSDLLRVLGAAWDGEPLTDGKGWPPRYCARRVVWHVIDHAWEIEDKQPPED